jgi:hypothetical protein
VAAGAVVAEALFAAVLFAAVFRLAAGPKILVAVTGFEAADAAVLAVIDWNRLENGLLDVGGAGDMNVGLVGLGAVAVERGCRVTGADLIGSIATAVCKWILIREAHRISFTAFK